MYRDSTLGVIIRRRRVELGWTQEELAERISADGEYVRQSEISRIESGRIALPRRERLERLATVLDLPLGELLARSGWAGARESFVGAVPQQVETHLPIGVAENSAPFDGTILRSTGGTRHSEAIHAFRSALSRMRMESERLSLNRQQATTIGLQLEKRYGIDPGVAWAGDQPEASDT